MMGVEELKGKGIHRSWVLIHTDDCDMYGTSSSVLHWLPLSLPNGLLHICNNLMKRALGASSSSQGGVGKVMRWPASARPATMVVSVSERLIVLR